MGSEKVIFTMTSWRVFEVQLPERPARTRHIAGYNRAFKAPQVSPPLISDFDPLYGTTEAEDGSTYQLLFSSKRNPIVSDKFDRWALANTAAEIVEVTNVVKMEQLKAAVQVGLDDSAAGRSREWVAGGYKKEHM
jgi:hypothetical protein